MSTQNIKKITPGRAG